MKRKPLISVVIPTYNSGEFIEACLKSLKNQTFKNFEIIVVDENSKDSTQKIAKKYADKLIIDGKERCQKRNIGAKNARADWVFFVDSDTELSPNILEDMSKLVDSKTLILTYDISFGKGFWAKVKHFERSLYTGGDVVQHPRVYPKKVFLGVGGFDDKMVGVEDLDLYNRVMKKYPKLKKVEVKSPIFHNEGRLTYRLIVKRMAYYSKTFREYKRRHPEIAKKQTSILRYLRKLDYFIKNPIMSFGFLISRGSEAAIAFYNMR